MNELWSLSLGRIPNLSLSTHWSWFIHTRSIILPQNVLTAAVLTSFLLSPSSSWDYSQSVHHLAVGTEVKRRLGCSLDLLHCSVPEPSWCKGRGVSSCFHWGNLGAVEGFPHPPADEARRCKTLQPFSRSTPRCHKPWVILASVQTDGAQQNLEFDAPQVLSASW